MKNQLKLNMNKQNLPYLIIVILLIIIFLQRSCNNTSPNPGPIIDTSHHSGVSYITLHDTIKGKTIYLPGKTDTSWRHDTLYTPSSDYEELLKQYDELGNKYFRLNTYKTKFPIKKYGSITVYDSVVSNALVSTVAIDSLKIPEFHDTFTITKTIPDVPKRQLYIGGGLFTSKSDPLSAAQVGVIYKDKHDQVFSLSIMYDGVLSYGVGYYWKIKLK